MRYHIALMAVAATAMWWLRRPQGSLGAPRVPADYHITRGILGIEVGMGLLCFRCSALRCC